MICRVVGLEDDFERYKFCWLDGIRCLGPQSSTRNCIEHTVFKGLNEKGDISMESDGSRK